MRSADTTRSALAILLGLTIAIIIPTSCSAISRVEKIHTLEANNLAEKYHEAAIWNRENNQPGECQQVRREMRMYLKTIKP